MACSCYGVSEGGEQKWPAAAAGCVLLLLLPACAACVLPSVCGRATCLSTLALLLPVCLHTATATACRHTTSTTTSSTAPITPSHCTLTLPPLHIDLDTIAHSPYHLLAAPPLTPLHTPLPFPAPTTHPPAPPPALPCPLHSPPSTYPCPSPPPPLTPLHTHRRDPQVRGGRCGTAGRQPPGCGPGHLLHRLLQDIRFPGARCA